MAVRLSWFWFLAAFLFGVVTAIFSTYSTAGMASSGVRQGLPSGFWLLTLLMIAFVMVGMTSVAIGWHRYVLRGEMPESFYVLRREWPLGSYIWSSIKITLLMIAVAFPLMIALSYLAPSLLLSSMGPAAVGTVGSAGLSFKMLTISLITSTPLIWVLMRFGVILPALAVGKKLSFGDAFRLTGTIAGPLFITAFGVVLFQSIPAILNLFLTVLIGSGTILTTVLMPSVTVVFSWLSFFISVGILTVIYGHLAENKPI